MRYVFFGTPEASKIVLEQLIEAGHVPVAVVTNPDRPAGRNHVLTPSPVKLLVTNRVPHIEILQPEKVATIAHELVALEPDAFIVAFYGKIIPLSILSIPKTGTLGIHPSLLPLYRGPSPIQTAILESAPEMGVTLYNMDDRMDEGPIVTQERLTTYVVGEKNNLALWHELAELGGKMTAKVLHDFIFGKLVSKPQDGASVTYTKKFSTEDAFISSDDLELAKNGNNPKLAHVIHQKILAFMPEPGAWTLENGKRLKLLESDIVGEKLILRKIQYEGKKVMIIKNNKE